MGAALFLSHVWKSSGDKFVLDVLDRFLARSFQEFQGMKMVASATPIPEEEQPNESDTAFDKSQVEEFLARREALSELVRPAQEA